MKLRPTASLGAANKTADFKMTAMGRGELTGTLRIPNHAAAREGWVVLRADCERQGQPASALLENR